MLTQRTSFHYILKELYDITKEFVPWIHSLMYLYIFRPQFFTRITNIDQFPLCNMRLSHNNKIMTRLNNSGMKNKEVCKAEAIKLSSYSFTYQKM